ncbi:Protein of unknown function [Pyronema omphalodes CBS 100304]|uniref:Uncharacterized protein n=1 Tax=Pyronema omphalodes (strain CBS 100304) TaxID=1076935 RepID=U4LQ07_PYROM|nr:Protein of unknown function [Pyronema omphalodes CBS 100304]
MDFKALKLCFVDCVDIYSVDPVHVFRTCTSEATYLAPANMKSHSMNVLYRALQLGRQSSAPPRPVLTLLALVTRQHPRPNSTPSVLARLNVKPVSTK